MFDLEEDLTDVGTELEVVVEDWVVEAEEVGSRALERFGAIVNCVNSMRISLI